MLVVYVMYVTLQNEIDKMHKMTNDLSETLLSVCLLRTYKMILIYECKMKKNDYRFCNTH